jgi:hypothetical protein
VLTGYGTDLTGEGELAAWELGAGCRDRTGDREVALARLFQRRGRLVGHRGLSFLAALP